MFPYKCKFVNSFDELRPSIDFRLFSEKLTIFKVLIFFNGDKLSMEFLLKLITIKFMHYDKHSNDPIAWLDKFIVKMT